MKNAEILKKIDLHKSEKRTSKLFIALPVIGFSVFTLITLVAVLFFSLTDANNRVDEYNWIWFKNYADLFVDQSYKTAFLRSIGNTLVLLLGVPIGMIAGLALAALLQSKAIKHKSKIFQVLFYVPAVTGAVAVNLVFRYIFNPEFGLINTIFNAHLDWYGNVWLVKVAIIIKNTWGSMGSTMILYLAGMLAIPQSYYEAADMDGASGARKFFKITLPLLTPTTFYLLITGIIGGLQSYADAQVFAEGMPGSQTIVYFIWEYGIHEGNQGLASAASLILAVFIMIVTFIQFKFSNKWVYED